MHRAWLEKNGIKKGSNDGDNVTNKISYLRKLINYNSNNIEPMSDNDISSNRNDLNENETGNVHTNEIISTRNTVGPVKGASLTSTTIAENITVTTMKPGKEGGVDYSMTTEQPPVHHPSTETNVEKIVPTTERHKDEGKDRAESENFSGVVNSTASERSISSSHSSLDENASPVISSGELVEAKKNNTTPPRNIWGPWSVWSECTRSCGGGVKSQSRKCLKKE